MNVGIGDERRVVGRLLLVGLLFTQTADASDQRQQRDAESARALGGTGLLG